MNTKHSRKSFTNEQIVSLILFVVMLFALVVVWGAPASAASALTVTDPVPCSTAASVADFDGELVKQRLAAVFSSVLAHRAVERGEEEYVIGTAAFELSDTRLVMHNGQELVEAKVVLRDAQKLGFVPPFPVRVLASPDGGMIYSMTPIPANPYRINPSVLARGEGDKDVLLISDPFCPFSRRAYDILTNEMDVTRTLSIAFLPLHVHPGAEGAAWVMQYALDNNLDAAAVVQFGHRHLSLPETPDVIQANLEVVKQFLSFFPGLWKSGDLASFYNALSTMYASQIQQQIADLKQTNIISTPSVYVGTEGMNGLNSQMLNKALGSSIVSSDGSTGGCGG
ncbi:MAG: hypothetical protein KKB70_01770 [Proteobacteria bacterium]|nr:hypothetical protein [Pseudomonadota bacterium]